ncbi:hypothetical protein [Nonomuraea sp. NPDC049158]|uniref:hypothetical protein n=1 Tax=Nonomuraea sp. NPDC049158 TaxID=3155649 RepID=UPI0033D59288
MKKLLSVIAMITIALVALPPAAGSATVKGSPSPACKGTSGQDAMVRAFVERTNTKWKIDLKAQDYEVQADTTGCTIKPRGSAPVTTQLVKDAAGRSTLVANTTAPPAPIPAKPGGATVQQETKWFQPTCYGRLGDAGGVGYMDTCFAWGDMNYPGQTRWNYAARAYATCGALEGGPDFWQVYDCSVRTWRVDNSAPLVWNEWSPKSTANLSSCGSVNLNVVAGPVSVGVSVNTCEKLIPAKGADPGDFKATWAGRSYWGSDVRETGLLNLNEPAACALVKSGDPTGLHERLWPFPGC